MVGNEHKVHAAVETGSQKHPSETTAGDVSSRDWCFWLPLEHPGAQFLRRPRARAPAQAPQTGSGLRGGETRQKQKASDLAGINHCEQVSGPLGSVSSVQQPCTCARPGQSGRRLERCVCSSWCCLRPWRPSTRTSLPSSLLGGQAGVIQHTLFLIFLQLLCLVYFIFL